MDELTSRVIVFDQARHDDEREQTYWDARELMTLLGYPVWREFVPIIERAFKRCTRMEPNPAVHFVATRTRQGRGRPYHSYQLSALGALLVVWEPDLRGEAIAAAQDHFLSHTLNRRLQGTWR